VKFRFVERCMFLGGSSTTFGKNESGIYSTAMKSMYPEHEWFFLSGGLLGTTNTQIPNDSCITRDT
jgi:hypothetical protein